MVKSRSQQSRHGWYHGWNIVAVCVVSQVSALALTINCFSLFLKDWTHAFNAPVSVLALSITIFSAGCAVAAPFAGVAADRYPSKWVFGLALLLLAAFHLTISYATAGWQIIALYALMLPAAVTCAASITASTVVSRWFVHRRGLAMGITAFGLALAGVIFPPVIVWLLPMLGWRVVWRIFAAVIALLVLPLVVAVLRDEPAVEEGARYIGAQAPADFGPRLTTREIFRRRNFWIALAVFVPVQCSYMAIGINLAPMAASADFSRTLAGIFIASMSISALISKLGAGVAADRFGNRLPLVAMGLVCGAGVIVLATAARQLPLMVVALVLIGLSQGVWTLMASATAAEFGARGFGRAFGIIGSFAPIGSLAPPVVAWLKEASGTYAPALIGLGLLTFCGAMVGLMMREREEGGDATAGPAAVAY
jgi:MFS family permease